MTTSRNVESLRGIANANGSNDRSAANSASAFGFRDASRESDELHLVAGERVDRAGVEHHRALGAVAHRDDGRVDPRSRMHRAQALLGRRAADHRDLLALEHVESLWIGPSLRTRSPPLSMNTRFEKSTSAMRDRRGRVRAVEVGAARLHRASRSLTVPGIQLTLRFGVADRAPDPGEDAAAQVDRVADRLPPRRSARTESSRASTRR